MNKPWEKQTVEERVRTLGGVPESDLRDLVEKWRAREAWHRTQCVTKAEGCGKAETFRECMNELESVIGSNSEGTDDL